MTKIEKGSIDPEEFRTLVRAITITTNEGYVLAVIDLVRRVKLWEAQVERAEDTTRDDWADDPTIAPYGQYGTDREAFLRDYNKRVAAKADFTKSLILPEKKDWDPSHPPQDS